MLGPKTRTLWTALVAAALLLGAASAQENATSTDAATTADADVDRAPTFHLKASPDALVLKSGGREGLKLFVESKTNQSFKLAMVEIPRGLSVKMSHETLSTGPENARRHVEVGIAAAPGMPRGEHRLVFVATSESGEKHEARVLVKVAGPAEKPAPRPTMKPTPEKPVEKPGLALRMDPEAQRTKGGERLTYTLVAHAPRNGTLALALRGLPEGYEATLSPETLQLVGGERAKATLMVYVPENATGATLVVHGKMAEGNATAAAKARVEVVRQPKPVRDEHDTRAVADGPGFRMQLYPRDALVGPEGGRALVLFEGGAKDVVVKLKPRLPDDAGWRVLAREHVKVPAHGQAWAWVDLQPGPDSGPLHYGLVGAGPLGHGVAEGTAQVERARTA